MFIYKITVIPINQVYIGFDTAPSYKLSRWKDHCKNAKLHRKSKLYTAMAKYGIENCSIEIVEDNFKSIVELAVAEIMYIEKYNSYLFGLNSTRGGDGLGRHILHELSNDDILLIKKTLGDRLSEYNKNVKWANTTIESRRELTKHLNTPEIIKKRGTTLKQFYNANPEIKKEKGKVIKQWSANNKEKVKIRNQINGLKGAAKVSKTFTVETEDGNILKFNSKSEFQRITKQ